MDALKDYFRPEFLNRLDDIILFDILSKENVRKIVDIQIDLVRERLLSKEIALELSPEALDYLAKEGFNPQYGARPLKRLIQNKILNPVAHLIITKGIVKGGVVVIGLKDNELTFDIKKGKRGSLVGDILMMGRKNSFESK
jgi:ATP-dependent Clp protease ATP-binding subunit ClpB